jgi:hybrid cluster-associated redox disulfide protein
MAAVTKDMTIMEAVNLDENIASVLMGVGMHCIGCMAAHGETIEEAAMVHGLDADELVNQINDFLAQKA